MQQQTKTNFQHLAVILGSCTAFLSSCKKDKYTDTLNYMYEYQPLAIGQYTIYDVDSVNYNYIDPIQYTDTNHYQQMEKITDTMYDNENRINYRFELYRRTDSTSAWSIWKVWYGLTTKTNYERQEDDLRFAKLVFPPVVDKHWNGNLYIPSNDSNIFKVYNKWDYHYTAVGGSATVNGKTFSETVSVSQVDEENLIDKRLSKEIYAKKVGLIYKEFAVINKQDIGSPWAYPFEAVGFRIVMQVNSYGP